MLLSTDQQESIIPIINGIMLPFSFRRSLNHPLCIFKQLPKWLIKESQIYPVMKAHLAIHKFCYLVTCKNNLRISFKA